MRIMALTMYGLNVTRSCLMKYRNIGNMFQRSLCITSSLPFRAVDCFPRTHHCRATSDMSQISQKAIYSSGNSFSSWNNFNRKDFLKLQTPRVITNFSRNVTISGKAMVDASPSAMQPYLRLMRIDRPIGIWLVFLPCAWSISLAVPAGQLPDPKMLTLFALGSFFMRGAGCVINDMWDKDFDSRVARTKDRPLASGELSRFRALCFLSMPLSISLAILLTFNWNTIALGVCSMIPCIIYPLMKRVTYWPQAFLAVCPTINASGTCLECASGQPTACAQAIIGQARCTGRCRETGLTFNWGAVMGWSAVRGVLDWGVFPLYASCIAWTLVYDTIYAFQDKEDDLHIGVKSTALKFGDTTKLWLTGFNSLITAGLLSTGYLTDQTWPYYLGVAFFTTHLGHQIYSVNLNDPESCGQKFRSNRNLGLIFWIMILAANLCKNSDEKSEELDSKGKQTLAIQLDSREKQLAIEKN